MVGVVDYSDRMGLYTYFEVENTGLYCLAMNWYEFNINYSERSAIVYFYQRVKEYIDNIVYVEGANVGGESIYYTKEETKDSEGFSRVFNISDKYDAITAKPEKRQ